MFVALSDIGSFGLVWVALAVAAALLRRNPRVLGLVVAADVLADGSAAVLKAVFGRPRPPLRYADPEPLVNVPTSSSFPSGHAATSFACAAILAGVTPLPATALFVLAAAIAWSRVYVGVHYPLDVVGGAVLGLAVAAAVRYAAAVAPRALRRRAGGPPRSR